MVESEPGFILHIRTHQAVNPHILLEHRIMKQQNNKLNDLKKQAAMLLQSKQLQQALELYKTICRTDRKDVASLCKAGMINGQLGNFRDAESWARKALKLQPGHATAHFILGSAMHAMGRYEDAVASFNRVVRAMPDNAAVYNNLGNALAASGRIDEAIDSYQKAVQLQPNFAEAFNNLGSAYLSADKLQQAESNFRQAIQINPRFSEACNNLGTVLHRQGHTHEAIEAYRHAIQLQPGHHKAHSNLLFLLAASASLSPARMLEEQREWDSIHGQAGRQQPLPARPPDAGHGRRLRIGYVSPDLRTHAVSRFFEPLLAASDHDRFEIFCYDASAGKTDKIKKRLRGLSDHWRPVSDKNDPELASLIHADNIDILVDLSGHTRGNRLQAFSYRPAPVQASYLGFFAATGLEAMDYWITDEVLHPDNTEEQTVETIHRLPRCAFCYQPPEEMPAISPCPSDSDQVTFGSFHDLSKLTPELIETWGRILHTLPGSRLLLMEKALGDPATRQRLIERFAQQDIPPDRLLLREGAPFAEYLEVYAEVDIVLDAFPRTGGTTTAEALWLGVPVITLAGRRYAGRISASKLAAVGLTDLIADSREDYVHMATALARDPARRARLRANLREDMAGSPLCDGQGLAQAMEAAYETMWERYLSQQTAPDQA